MKKKLILTFVFAICLIVPAMFMLTACGGNDTPPAPEKTVVGSWETYQVIFPAKTEGEETTTYNLGDFFDFLGGETLSKDTYKITVTDNQINLTMLMGKDNTSVSGSGSYTEKEGVYSSSIVVNAGSGTETFKTTSTYDKENDRLKCNIVYYETNSESLYYTLVLTRVNG